MSLSREETDVLLADDPAAAMSTLMASRIAESASEDPHALLTPYQLRQVARTSNACAYWMRAASLGSNVEERVYEVARRSHRRWNQTHGFSNAVVMSEAVRQEALKRFETDDFTTPAGQRIFLTLTALAIGAVIYHFVF